MPTPATTHRLFGASSSFAGLPQVLTLSATPVAVRSTKSVVRGDLLTRRTVVVVVIDVRVRSVARVVRLNLHVLLLSGE